MNTTKPTPLQAAINAATTGKSTAYVVHDRAAKHRTIAGKSPSGEQPMAEVCRYLPLHVYCMYDLDHLRGLDSVYYDPHCFEVAERIAENLLDGMPPRPAIDTLSDKVASDWLGQGREDHKAGLHTPYVVVWVAYVAYGSKDREDGPTEVHMAKTMVESSKLAPGDLVALKGSPDCPMMVSLVEDGKALVCWIDVTGQTHSDRFPLECLTTDIAHSTGFTLERLIAAESAVLKLPKGQLERLHARGLVTPSGSVATITDTELSRDHTWAPTDRATQYVSASAVDRLELLVTWARQDGRDTP